LGRGTCYGALRRLRRRPELERIALVPGRAVLRLEVGMRDVRILVERLDDLAVGKRRLDVAARLAERLRRLRRLGELLRLRHGRAPAVLRSVRLVPLDLERLLRLHRVPGRVGDDRDARKRADAALIAGAEADRI